MTAEVRCGRCKCLSLGGDATSPRYNAGMLPANVTRPDDDCDCTCHAPWRFAHEQTPMGPIPGVA